MDIRLGIMLVGLLGAGCSAVPAAGQAALSQRMVLTWHQNLDATPKSIAGFEALASGIAGVQVRWLAAVNERVFAISLDCGSASNCDMASRRLHADDRVVDLRLDKRVGRHDTVQPPSRSP